MTAPWSTMPVTGAQHDAWLAQEREQAGWPEWVQSVEADGGDVVPIEAEE